MDQLLRRLDIPDAKTFRSRYKDAITAKLEAKTLLREPHWTESLAVGSRDFVAAARANYTHRYAVDLTRAATTPISTWIIRETREPYGAV